MKAEEFDKKFDDGEEDITSLLDLSKTRHPIIDKEKQELLESFENGEWVQVANTAAEIYHMRGSVDFSRFIGHNLGFQK